MSQNQQNNAVNHHTYLRRLTSKGIAACMKRVSERMLPEIKITMGRLTNPYNIWAGSKIPFMQRVYNYVVLNIQECMKQPATRSRIQVGSPKVIIRHKNLELGIARKTEVWGDGGIVVLQ